MMKIQIQRQHVRKETCDGILMIEGDRICDTTERTFFRIPAGTYRIVLRYLSAQKRKVPVLIPLEERGPRRRKAYLGIGNGIFHHVDSRILLGTFIAPGCVKCSRPPFIQLYDRINNAQRRGNEVFIEIKENDDDNPLLSS